MIQKKGLTIKINKINKSLTLLLIIFLFSSILFTAAEEIEEKVETNKEIKIIYPSTGVYTPNSGTYQPYKNIKAHFIIPKIIFPDDIISENTAKIGTISKNPIKEYELIESGYTIGRYKATDTEPNTAIITTYGLHTMEIQGYDAANNTIAKESVEFYAGFNYVDLYTILQETPAITIANKASKEDTNTINISYNDYEKIYKNNPVNKSYSYITAVDKLTNSTIEHTKITIRLALEKDIYQSQIMIYELYPLSVIPLSVISTNSNFNKLLLSDNFMIVQKALQDSQVASLQKTIIAWKEDNILPFQEQITKTYYINQKLEQKQIEEITTIIVTETGHGSNILWHVLIALTIAAIIISWIFYYKNYRKDNHKIELYDIEEKKNMEENKENKNNDNI